MTALGLAFAEARRGLRRRRRRSLLSAVGIALAAAMLSASVVVADGLGRGFDRAARAADLPDMIVRFDPETAARVAERIRALPDVASFAMRFELTNVGIGVAARRRGDAVVEVLSPSARRGYAIVVGRDLRPIGSEVLVERAFAQAWNISLGSRFYVSGLGAQTVVGFAESPDNVGFPLAKPRFYLARSAIDARFGPEPDPRVNVAEIWLRSAHYLNEVLVQARASSFGLHNIRFATRAGVRVLLDQAAGIVIDLLVALSAIALVTAGAMLAASAAADVQRRLGAIGVRRAVGASRGHIVLAQAVEGALIALPAASLGVIGGLLATQGSADRLLTLLNEPPPGGELALPLLAAWAGAVALPAAGAAWPAWRATGGPVVGMLRGADVSAAPGAARPGGRARRAGLGVLGARLVASRRIRLVTAVVTLGLSAGFVLLMLALASALSSLETDPGALGKHYQLTAALPVAAAGRVSRIPGVEAAAPRYEVTAADSFSLGETIDVIAYPGDHVRFEAPALISGRRLRRRNEAEVGAGLAEALGLSTGSTLAIALPTGAELRLRVAGIVSSLDHEGRVAYVPASALLAADPPAPATIAIRLVPRADQAAVSSALAELGAVPAAASGATARGAPLVDTLRTILRAVAVLDGLVCLYALIQASALTVQERRRTVAVLRACGAGPGAVRRLLAGAALAIVVPAALVGVLLERFVFGPELAHLAASYATLQLDPTAPEVLSTLAGLGMAAVLAVIWVARRVAHESVVDGLAT